MRNTRPKTPFGAHLRRRRIQAGLTQPELAELVGMKPASISRFEIGHYLPSLWRLKKIAKALDCELVIELQKHV